MWTNLPLDWIFLGLLLLALIYTMVVIKEEKTSYLENAKPLNFGPYIFYAPSWWTWNQRPNEMLFFERTDTRYDWKASICWLEKPLQDIEHTFIEVLKEKNLEFDEINSVIQRPEMFQNHPLVKRGIWEICRIEGTATKALTERVYYDAYLIWDHSFQKYIYCESESSVLNGLVEGPYFEEMMTIVKES